MKRNAIRILLLCCIALGLVSIQIAYGEQADRQITVKSERPLSYVEQDRISYMAARALRHIAAARGYIYEQKVKDAKDTPSKSG